MTLPESVAVFTLDGQRFGLDVAAVQGVLRAAWTTPLPDAPEIVMGVVNVHGDVLPVVNVRRRFGYPERDVRLSDRFVVARTALRRVVLLVDAVEGNEGISPEAMTTAQAVVPGLEYVAGIVKTADGMVLIHDLDSFLSLEEEQTLSDALLAHEEGTA